MKQSLKILEDLAFEAKQKYGDQPYLIRKLSLLPISVNDTASISIQQIRAQAKKMKRKGKCDIIMIDYLQLMDMSRLK